MAAPNGEQQVVFVWGAGEDGQLGLAEAPAGTDEWHMAQPTQVPGLAALGFRTDVADVHQPLVGGSRHSLVVTSGGAVFTWGWNEKLALGLGNRAEAKTPQRVKLPADARVVQVRAPLHAHVTPCASVCLSVLPGIVSWGTQAGKPPPHVCSPAAVSLARLLSQACLGGWHGIAVTDAGETYAWCARLRARRCRTLGGVSRH